MHNPCTLSNFSAEIEPNEVTLGYRRINFENPSPHFLKTLDSELLRKALVYPSFEKQVIIHCSFTNKNNCANNVRIWQSTFLVPKDSTAKPKLLHAENISYFPCWTEISAFHTHRFTLIFEGLPFWCKSFSLVEEIPEPGGFVVKGIRRRKKDIYHIAF
jgi:hypothetical protein